MKRRARVMVVAEATGGYDTWRYRIVTEGLSLGIVQIKDVLTFPSEGVALAAGRKALERLQSAEFVG